MENKRKFLKNYWSDSELDKMRESYERYWSFLESIKAQLPCNVYEFAKAEWHYDHMNPKCPHDAWLESLEIKESAIDGDIRRRTNSIKIILLGAFHDGRIHLSYEGVTKYIFEKDVFLSNGTPPKSFKNGHGDWLIDEFSISNENSVIHYIEFSNGVNWEIHFQDFTFEWEPFES